MIERISLVLKTKNITPAQLADELGVQRSGISHILNGRNKPSLDFVQKLVKRYPDINLNWMMFGEGAMMNPYPYKSVVEERDRKILNAQPTIVGLFPEDSMEDETVSENKHPAQDFEQELMDEKSFEEIKENDEYEIPERTDTPKESKAAHEPVSHTIHTSSNERPVVKNNREISRIIIFYKDKSFVEYTPGSE